MHSKKKKKSNSKVKCVVWYYYVICNRMLKIFRYRVWGIKIKQLKNACSMKIVFFFVENAESNLDNRIFFFKKSSKNLFCIHNSTNIIIILINGIDNSLCLDVYSTQSKISPLFSVNLILLFVEIKFFFFLFVT